MKMGSSKSAYEASQDSARRPWFWGKDAVASFLFKSAIFNSYLPFSVKFLIFSATLLFPPCRVPSGDQKCL